MDLARFKKLPLLGIIRCAGQVPIEDLVESIVSSGLETIEIAMNSDSADSMIRRAVKAAKGRIMIGAGTVMHLDTLKTALDAGATFIVSPTLMEDVVSHCVKNVVPVFPGALTPHEIYNAWHSGATMVKVFPAGVFGPSYIREVKAPFSDIELLACGGVTAENIKSYFDSGVKAVAFGGSIFKKELLDKKEFKKIEHSIKELISKIR